MNEYDARTVAAPAPDIDLVPGDDWPQRDFPIDDGRRKDSVRVVIRQSVLNDVHQHGLSRTDVEICGVLVGNVYRDERGPFVYVEANIRGRHSDSQPAQVTFTSETWNHIHGEMDRDHPDQRILGWYHTHPGFGIFLSGMDLFIHENFFNGHEQMALVFDPISGDEGLFLWRGGKAVRDGFLIHHDAAEVPLRKHAVPASDPPLTAGAGSMANVRPSGDLSARLATIERRQMLGCLAILFTLTLAVAVPLATWFVWPGPVFLLRDANNLQHVPPPDLRVDTPFNNSREQLPHKPPTQDADHGDAPIEPQTPKEPEQPKQPGEPKTDDTPRETTTDDQPPEPTTNDRPPTAADSPDFPLKSEPDD